MHVRHGLAAALLLTCTLARAEVSSAAAPSRTGPAEGPCPAAQHIAAAMKALLGKDLPRAEALATDAVKAFPEDPHPWDARSIIRMERGDLDGAVADVERALAIHDEARFRTRAAGYEYRRNRLAPARDHARRALMLDPGDTRAWAFLANLEVVNGDSAAAVRAIAEALRLDRNDEVVANTAGRISGFVGERAFKEALMAGPPPAAREHHARAAELAAAGKWAESIGESDAALQVDPTFADCHYNIGVAAAQLGELDRAEAAYGRALALYKPHESLLRADALNNLAHLHVRRGTVGPEDVARAREALSLDRGRPAKLDTLARACDAVRDRACAREAYAALVSSSEPVRDEVRKNAVERLQALQEQAAPPPSGAGGTPAGVRGPAADGAR
jgi:tetratricopeptide (TPR) repeat protein